MNSAQPPSSFGRCATRLMLALITGAFVVAGVMAAVMTLHATPGPAPTPSTAATVQLTVDRTGPREVEEQTQRAIVRDYGAAWNSMARALDSNDPGALGELWVGFARQKLLDAIAQQKAAGLRVRYIHRGHKLEGAFYSPEGSALELHDTAQLEMQTLDDGTVIDSQQVTAHYLVVMTPTADHWQVRILQAVPVSSVPRTDAVAAHEARGRK